MQNNSKNGLKVFVNKNITGALNFENDTYIFNYKDDAKDIVSLTMPIRRAPPSQKGGKGWPLTTKKRPPLCQKMSLLW